MTKAPNSDPTSEALVIIVTGDEGLSERLEELLGTSRIETLVLESTDALFATTLPDRPCCLVLDVELGKSSAYNAWARMVQVGRELPIVMVTSPGDVSFSASTLADASPEILRRPLRAPDAIKAIESAIGRDRDLRRIQRENALLAATLSVQEAEVMTEIVKELLNKQIAYNLGISETAVKIHRGSVMRKMKAFSVADLARKIAFPKEKL